MVLNNSIITFAQEVRFVKVGFLELGFVSIRYYLFDVVDWHSPFRFYSTRSLMNAIDLIEGFGYCEEKFRS